MKYTKFIIKNFKGIHELNLDLEKPPFSNVVTLVGLNESGKTSILEAINTFLADCTEPERHKLIPKKDKLKFSGSVSVAAFLSTSKEDNIIIKNYATSIGIKHVKPIGSIYIEKRYSFSDSISTGLGNFWTINIQTSQDGKTYVTLESKDDNWKKLVTYIQNNLIPKILYYPDFLFDFPNRIYLDDETSAIKNQLQFRDVIQDVLSSIDKDLTIQKHLIDRIKDSSEGVQESLEHTLSKMSAQISKVVLGAWKNIMNIRGKEIFVEAKAETIKIVSKNPQGQNVTKEKKVFYLEFKLKEGAEKYYISERSLGFKWFFTFLLFTEFRKNRKTDLGETLFLLDEPASNLHSTAQKKLLSKFAELVTKCHLVYTTHSHHLINPKWLGGTYIVKNEAINYSKAFDFDSTNTNITAIPYKQFVASNPKQRDYFQPVLDALDYQPGLLEKVPDIILTEGKNDYYIFRYINDVVFGKKYSELRFYPGNGANSNEYIIRLYLAWGRNFTIFLDGDKAGEEAKKKYIKEIGREISDLIYTFRDVDQLFSFPVEDLFDNEERLAITKEFDKNARSYEKSKFNTAIQTRYVNKEPLALSKATTEKFEKIYRFLNEHHQR